MLQACSDRAGFRQMGIAHASQAFQSKLGEQLTQALRRTALFLPRVPGHNQFVFHAVFPAHQLGDRDLVAASLQIQTAQHIGNLTAHLASVVG